MKALKIIGKVLLMILICIVILLLLIKMGEKIAFFSFYKNAESEFRLPGMNEGYVPQGFDYVEEKNVFLACGYMSNGKASRVYVIDRDGKSTMTELKKADGSDYKGHTGGVSHYYDESKGCDYLYITGSKGIDVFTYSDVMSGKSETKLLGTVYTYGVDPAYCSIKGDTIYVGSFYKEGDYDTPEHLHFTTPAGDTNKASLLSFKLDSESEFGVESIPYEIYSMPNFVQGICFTDDGKIVLSTSWGLSVSHLYVHDLARVASTSGSTDALGEEVGTIPLFYMDSSTLVDTISAPPMAEELVYLDGKIWVMNESACNKYIFGKFMSGYFLYSYKY